MKKVILRLVGYSNAREYWNVRWRLGLQAEKWTRELIQKETKLIAELMRVHDCKCLLEVGCGAGQLRSLKGYMGLDYSLNVMKKSKLPSFIYADITDPKLAIPTDSFDAVLTRFVLLHIPFQKIRFAVNNICRIAQKLIILREPHTKVPKQTHFHCFSHNLPDVFKQFKGEVVFLEK